MTRAAFIIITRNRKEKLEKCIRSIRLNAPTESIVVVDNGSEDGTHELQASLNMRIVHLEHNKGVAGARNVGIEHAQKEFNPNYLVFMDDDASLERISFDLLQKTFENNPDCGIIAPLIQYPDGRIQESLRAFPTIRALIWRGFTLDRLFKPTFYERYVNPARVVGGQVDWAIGACLIIKKEVFDTIGNFNEKYFLVYDDADICRRALLHNFKTVYDPSTLVIHEYARKSSNLFSLHALKHALSIIRFLLTK